MPDLSANETLGQRVRRLRRAQGLSIDRFARAAEVSKNQVTAVESDATHNLMSDTLTKYAAVLGVSPQYIISGQSDQAVQGPPPELGVLYGQLAAEDHHALLYIGRALKESRDTYQPEAIDIPVNVDQLAAFDEPETERDVDQDPWPS